MVIAAIKFQSCGYIASSSAASFHSRHPRTGAQAWYRTNIKYMGTGAGSFFPRGNENNFTDSY